MEALCGDARPKVDPCPTITEQLGSCFSLCKDHTYRMEKHKKIRLELLAETKTKCVEQKYTSANAIYQLLDVKAHQENPDVKLPGPQSLAAAGNRMCAKARPKHQQTQFFELDFTHVHDGFFQ